MTRSTEWMMFASLMSHIRRIETACLTPYSEFMVSKQIRYSPRLYGITESVSVGKWDGSKFRNMILLSLHNHRHTHADEDNTPEFMKRSYDCTPPIMSDTISKSKRSAERTIPSELNRPSKRIRAETHERIPWAYSVHFAINRFPEDSEYYEA